MVNGKWQRINYYMQWQPSVYIYTKKWWVSKALYGGLQNSEADCRLILMGKCNYQVGRIALSGLFQIPREK